VEVTIAILSGLVLSFVTFEIGNRVNGKNKVSEDTCKERREACNNLVCVKIDALHDKLDEIAASSKK
jgi:hypothetical protein